MVMSAKLVVVIAFIALIIIVIMVILLRQEPEPQLETHPENEHNPYKDAELTVEIIPAPNDTYGYNILMNGRALIHQPSIPALPGVEGFKTEEDARKVGELVIDKIRQNIFPPSVSVVELDSLGVLN